MFAGRPFQSYLGIFQYGKFHVFMPMYTLIIFSRSHLWSKQKSDTAENESQEVALTSSCPRSEKGSDAEMADDACLRIDWPYARFFFWRVA